MTRLRLDIVVPVRIEERDLAPSIWHLTGCQTMISYTMDQQIGSRLGADLFLLDAPGVNVTSLYVNAPESGERVNGVSWLSDDFSRRLCGHTDSGPVHCQGGSPQRP